MFFQNHHKHVFQMQFELKFLPIWFNFLPQHLPNSVNGNFELLVCLLTFKTNRILLSIFFIKVHSLRSTVITYVIVEMLLHWLTFLNFLCIKITFEHMYVFIYHYITIQICIAFRDWLRVRFGRTSAEISDKQQKKPPT